MEKEYVSIFGIFASIVLAFVGGITFSTSVLQNIDKVSIFRLLLVVDMIAFTMINVLNLLIDFIAKINGKENKVMDIILISIAIFIGLVWMFNLQDIPNYLRLNFNSGGFIILRILYPPTFIIEPMFSHSVRECVLLSYKFML
ncbi:hypothetical protein [Kandleria vitulina]|uniref:hypothetical protein n=1 Tax=Kandleria vitulina TaxID=1630 RepID=UPI000684AB12|nr:hypothetical protein [Kandleria vitulina]